MLLQMLMCKCVCVVWIAFSYFGCICRSGILGHMIILMFNKYVRTKVRITRLFSIMTLYHVLYSYQQITRDLIPLAHCLHQFFFLLLLPFLFLPSLLSIHLSDLCLFSICEQYLIVVLLYIFLITWCSALRKIYFLWKELHRERERELACASYFPNSHNGWGLAMLELGARNFILVSHMTDYKA